MEICKNYDLSRDEYWYSKCMEAGLFASSPDDRPAFSIVIPPPNVTGVLHMGHALNETVQDIIARRARKNGFNVCWVPGSDHASIATEAKVVNMLAEKGIDKRDISREEFLKYAYEWKDKYGSIIIEQIKKLGCTCDWDRNTFTMDEHYYQAVIKVFVQLYEEGMIYRGARMINWDPAAQTALSDEEVEYKDVQGKLYYIKYFLSKEDGTPSEEYVEVATKRPETIMGDTAICVNPNDVRYEKYIGQEVIVPMVGRRVKVIADPYVEIDFGTGVLKITPAHDINDYEIGLRHQLEVIDTLDDEAKISEAAGKFVGMDRFEARKAAVKEMEESGELIKVEDYNTRIGYSQRSGSVVEPKISTQWFLAMEELSKYASDAVTSAAVTLYPKGRFDATYHHWMNNIKDWCISRQLWWGQRIPAYYDLDGNIYVAESADSALAQAQEKNPSITSLRQDEDCLDTWFSSWIWPMEVFRGITQPTDNADFEYYYPTTTLVTGQDIIFFWVARMVMAGYKFKNTKPFSDVYFTGLVRDEKGRKMSKSLGNSPDLLELISEFGTDAVRFGIMVSSPAGNDLLFSEDYLNQGRNFVNKIWNAYKLIRMWQDMEIQEQEYIDAVDQNKDYFQVDWMHARIQEAKLKIEELAAEYKINQCLMQVYTLIWEDFCSWYLEWAKPEYGAKSMDAYILNHSVQMMEELMSMLNPFMPFVTEEVYQGLGIRAENEFLVQKEFSKAEEYNPEIILQGERLKNLISAVRNLRTQNKLKNKDSIEMAVDASDPEFYQRVELLLRKQLNCAQVSYGSEVPDKSKSLVVDEDKFYLNSDAFDEGSGEDKIQLEKELKYYEGFLNSVNKKLSNEKFVQNAKTEVVDAEKKKKSDAENKIKAIKETLSNLG